jgi:hypothetical protein
MNTLASYIQANNLIGAPAEIVAFLAASEYVRLDQSRYSYQGLSVHPDFGIEKTAVLLATMKALFTHPVLGGLIEAEYWAFVTPSADGQTGGIDLSEYNRNTNLRTIASVLATGDADNGIPANPVAASVLNDAANIGGGWKAKWETAGLDSLPNGEQVAEALQQIADTPWDNGSSLKGKLHNLRNTILNLYAAAGSDPLTKAEAAAICDLTEVDRLVAEIKAEIV